MRSRISENESLKKAFREAYSGSGGSEPGEVWQVQAMKRIRQIGPLEPAADFWDALQALVWRLTPVSCVLVLVLAFILVNMDFDVDSDYLATMAGEMEKPSLLELFDLEG